MNLLSLAVKVMCDDQATSAIGKISSGVKSGLATVGKAATAAVGAAAAGAAVVGKSALDAYASYEQLVGGVNKLYGAASGKLQQYADQAYQTAGMSANQYMEQATSFSAALITSLGGDVEKAADQTDVAMRAMADNVNVFGSNMTDVQNAFQGFAKQNYTMLDNLKLGYGGTKEEMQRLIDKANELAAKNGQAADLSIDSFSDIVTAISLVQTEMGITGATFSESAGTISGSIASMQASWSNWVTALANPDADLGAYSDRLFESVVTAGENIAPRIGVIITSMGTVLQERGPELAEKAGTMLVSAFTGAFNFLSGWISENFNIQLPQISTDDVYWALDQVAQVLQTLKDNADWLVPSLAAVAGGIMAFQAASTITGIIQGLQVAFTTWRTATEGMTIAQAALNMVMNANPFILVATIIGTLVAAFITLMATNEDFRNTVMNAWGEIEKAASSVWGSVVDFFTVKVPGALQDMTKWFSELPGKIWGFLSKVISDVGKWASDMINRARETGSGFVTNVVEFIQSLPGRAWSLLMAVISRVGSFASSIVERARAAGSGFVNGIISFIQGLPMRIWGFLNSAIQSISSFAASIGRMAWSAGQSFVNSLSAWFNSAVQFVAGIPGRIVRALGNVGSLLWNAGASIINGLANGIWSAVGAATGAISGVLDRVRQYLPFSPAKKGPFSGKGWTLYSGQSMVNALADGVSAYGSKAVDAMEGVMTGMSEASYVNAGAFGTAKGYSTASSVENAKNVTLNVTVNGAGKDAREIAQELYNLEQRYDRGWR